jgi:hypothetical protein
MDSNFWPSQLFRLLSNTEPFRRELESENEEVYDERFIHSDSSDDGHNDGGECSQFQWRQGGWDPREFRFQKTTIDAAMDPRYFFYVHESNFTTCINLFLSKSLSSFYEPIY